MSTVYKFHFEIHLIKNLPNDITQVLSLANGRTENYEELIKNIEQSNPHPFFKCERWAAMFFKSAFYEEGPSFNLNRQGYGVLKLHGEIRNHCGNIRKFAEWISTYVAGRKNLIYMGWSKLDELYQPQTHYWWSPKEAKLIYGTSKESAEILSEFI